MSISKALFTIFRVALLASLGMGCGGAKVADTVTVLKLTSVLPPGHPSSEALAFFEERLEILSDGKIDVKIFLSAQLGGAVETVELCRGGNVEVINCSSSSLTPFEPIFKVLEMPFIFRNNQHQYQVLDGPVGEAMKDELKELDLTLLACFGAGSRNIMTKKGPIQNPDDLAGFKIRVMPSPLLLSSLNALGASAIPMNQGEVYSALQMGVLDGWENNPPTTLNFRMYETGCIYYTRTSHSSIPDLLLMSSRSFNRLTPNLQNTVMQAAKETQAKQRELWATAETQAEEELQAEGMIFTPIDQEPFKDRIQDIYEDMYSRYGEKFRNLCQSIQETQP